MNNKRSNLKTKLFVVILIIFLILISYFTWNFLFPQKEKHYLTVKEFLDDWEYNSPSKYKSYSVGDIVTIKDTVINSSIIYAHEIEINNSGWGFCSVLNEIKILTLVHFKSCRNLYWLEFTGNRTNEFAANKSVIFNVEIKEYDYVPYFFEEEGVFLIEEAYNGYLLMFEQHIQRRSKDNCSISLEIENKNINNVLINITNISLIESTQYYKDRPDNTVNAKSLHFVLFCNGSEIDDLIPNANQIVGKNNFLKFIPTYSPLHMDLTPYELFLKGESISIGDKVLINMTLLENQNYELKICWRYTYPEPGYENERIVGNITFSI